MRGRPFVILWGATVAAVLFLGAIWGTVGRLSSSGRGPADAIVTGLAALGLVASLFAAGRIVVVMGRVQRRDRSRRGNGTTTASARAPRTVEASEPRQHVRGG